jgi:uncharacterized protein YdhG (YjbR/CyaY superfamily)
MARTSDAVWKCGPVLHDDVLLVPGGGTVVQSQLGRPELPARRARPDLRHASVMAGSVQAYIDAISSEQRPLFDRLHGLIVATFPDVTILLSYGMPTYDVGGRRLYVGVWKHGLSIYGWEEGHDAGFVDRHPALSSGKGTIRLRPSDAAAIGDDELRALVRAALEERPE